MPKNVCFSTVRLLLIFILYSLIFLNFLQSVIRSFKLKSKILVKDSLDWKINIAFSINTLIKISFLIASSSFSKHFIVFPFLISFRDKRKQMEISSLEVCLMIWSHLLPPHKLVPHLGCIVWFPINMLYLFSQLMLWHVMLSCLLVHLPCCPFSTSFSLLTVFSHS